MKNGMCPKCGSATIYSKTEGLKYSAMKGVVFVETGHITVPSQTIAYVCTTCGYFENYITDQSKLTEVLENWQKVPPHE